MKKLILGRVLTLGVVVAAKPAFAYHAFAAEYDASKPVTLHGKLT